MAQTLTLNWLDINDGVNYIATWEEEQPYDTSFWLTSNSFSSPSYIKDYKKWTKTIKIKWIVKGSSWGILSIYLNQLKNLINNNWVSISLNARDNKTYTWIYTCQNLVFDSNNYNLTFIKYEATIIITEYLQSTIKNTVSGTTSTPSVWVLNLPTNFQGISYLNVKFTVNSITSIASIKFALSNSSGTSTNPDWVFIIYVSWLIATDYLEVDGKENTVTKNWSTTLDYYWQIPTVPEWPNTTLLIEVNWVSVNFTTEAFYYVTLL